MASTRNLLLQQVNSNIYALRFALGVKGGLFVGGPRRIHNIPGLSRVRHVRLAR
jgi:hypothetical protein